MLVTAPEKSKSHVIPRRRRVVSEALIDTMPQQQRQTPLRRALGTCSNATMVPPFNQRLAYRAVAELNARRIPGDIVELGVWKGGVSCLMAMAQLQTGAETGFGRRLWLFDTFEGMPKPTQLDDRRAQRLWQRITNGTLQRAPGSVRDKKWAYSPIDEVRSTMARTGYPSNQISFVKGKVEDTLPTTTLPKSIALLRLDTDWFESTKVELDMLWPLLSPGGWMYVDDYSAFLGSRRAVDRWLAAKGWVEEAKKAKAAKQTRNKPRSEEHDQLGSFYVWKASPYDEKHPFDLRNESITALWRREEAAVRRGDVG